MRKPTTFLFSILLGACASMPKGPDGKPLPSAAGLEAADKACDFAAFGPHMSSRTRGPFLKLVASGGRMEATMKSLPKLIKDRFGVEPTVGPEGEIIYKSAGELMGATQDITLSFQFSAEKECKILTAFREGLARDGFLDNCEEYRAEGSDLVIRMVGGRCTIDVSEAEKLPPPHMLHLIGSMLAKEEKEVAILQSSNDSDFKAWATGYLKRAWNGIRSVGRESRTLEHLYKKLPTGFSKKEGAKPPTALTPAAEVARVHGEIMAKTSSNDTDEAVAAAEDLLAQVRDDHGQVIAGLQDADLARTLELAGLAFERKEVPGAAWFFFFNGLHVASRLDDALHGRLIARLKTSLALARKITERGDAVESKALAVAGYEVLRADEGASPEARGRSAWVLADFLIADEESEAGKTALDEALKHLDAALDTKDWRLRTPLMMAAKVRSEGKDLKGSLPYYGRLHDNLVAAENPDHPWRIPVGLRYANILQVTGDVEAGRKVRSATLARLNETNSLAPSERVGFLVQVTDQFLLDKAFDKAEATANAAADVVEKQGVEPAAALSALDTLAQMHSDHKRYEQAVAFLGKFVAVAKAHMSKQPAVAGSGLCAQANALEKLGKADAANTARTEGRKLMESELGAEHAELQRCNPPPAKN